MRSPFTMLSLGLLWLVPASIGYAATSPVPAPSPSQPSATASPESPIQLAQYIPPPGGLNRNQQDLFNAQREAERQQAADRIEQMRQQMQTYQQQWQGESREWRARQQEVNDRLQDRLEEAYDQYYGDSEARYIDEQLYRPYGDRDSGANWSLRLQYGDDGLGVNYGLPYIDSYRYYSESYYPYGYTYDPNVYQYDPGLIDRVYTPYPVITFGDNSLVHLDLVSTTPSTVSVVLLGGNGSQQLAFDSLNQSQSVYLAAGTYQIAFIDTSNNRTWLSGYLDLGFSPVVRIEFDPVSQSADLYGDPYAWRAE